jgi:hypothetical protein
MGRAPVVWKVYPFFNVKSCTWTGRTAFRPILQQSRSGPSDTTLLPCPYCSSLSLSQLSSAASSLPSLRRLLLRLDSTLPTRPDLRSARHVVVAPSSGRRDGRGRRGGGPDRLHVHRPNPHGLPPPRQRDPRPQGAPPLREALGTSRRPVIVRSD